MWLKALKRPEILLIGIALLILLGTILLSYQDWQMFQKTSGEATLSRDLIQSILALASSLTSAETAQRGFLLTNDEKYLEPYDRALTEIPRRVKRLTDLTANQPAQAARMERLSAMVSDKLAELKLTIDTEKSEGSEAAVALVRSGRGREMMDQFRALATQIAREQIGPQAARQRLSELHGQRTRVVITAGSAILFVFLLVAGTMIGSAAERRERLIEQLHASEKRSAEVRDLLQTTLSSIGDGVVATDAQGKVTFVNPIAQAITGYSGEESAGRPLDEIFHIVNEDTRQPVQSPVAQALREGIVVGMANHTMLIARDGREIAIDDSGAPIRGADGSILGVVLVFRDISGRKKADEAVQRLALIVESSDDAIIAQKLDGVITDWNAAAERMFGYSAGEIVGRNFSLLIPEDSREDPREIVERIRRGDSAIHYEAVRRRKDGSRLDVAAAVSPIRDLSGGVIGVSRINRDITERKRTQEALRASEEQLRLSAEAAELGAWNRDLTTDQVTWSPQLEKIYGLAPGSFRGTINHFAELIHPDDRQRVCDANDRAMEEQREFEVEFRAIRPDGEVRWMLSRGRPVYSGSQAVGLAGITMDVTSRTRLEEKVRQSQKLESLGVLAGGIAHDFNNLLVGILGNASVLMEEIPGHSPLRDVIENLTQASERAAHLTRQMLAYSGKGRFIVERLNIPRQVQEILALIDASIPKGVKVELHFEEKLPAIEGDSGQIQQLIMNLVINGAEAIGTAGGTVTVSAALRDIGKDYVRDNLAGDTIPPGSYVLLEVHDNGIGMDAATQARIFDPFFTTKFTGRGLGLAAVLGIVRGHRGALTVYSQPGQGTTFKVFLPAARTHEPIAEALKQSSEFRGEGTILVVDDEELVQRTLKTALERYGYSVVTVGGGREAMVSLQEKGDEISLVLLDMTMPGMSGEETLHALRGIRSDVPVIATSGYNEMDALRRFGEGLSGFIQKPYTPRKLAEKIHGVLQRGTSLGTSV